MIVPSRIVHVITVDSMSVMIKLAMDATYLNAAYPLVRHLLPSLHSQEVNLRGSPHRYFGSWRITGAHPAIELNSVNERSMLVRAIIRSFDTRQNRADDISFIPVTLGVRRPDHTCRFSGLSHQRVAYSYSRVGIVQLSQQELQLQVSNGRFNYMWTPACNLRLGASLVCA